jgi:hypothetical protein
MALERINVRHPKMSKMREPGVDLHEGLRPNPIDATLGFDACLDEACLTQDAQVLGHGRLRHPQPALNLAN